MNRGVTTLSSASHCKHFAKTYKVATTACGPAMTMERVIQLKINEI